MQDGKSPCSCPCGDEKSGDDSRTSGRWGRTQRRWYGALDIRTAWDRTAHRCGVALEPRHQPAPSRTHCHGAPFKGSGNGLQGSLEESVQCPAPQQHQQPHTMRHFLSLLCVGKAAVCTHTHTRQVRHLFTIPSASEFCKVNEYVSLSLSLPTW